MHSPILSEIERIYKSNSHRVLATLIHILGDLDRAEEALQDAFSAALKQWPLEGMQNMGQLTENAFDYGLIVATRQPPERTAQVRLEKGEFSVSDGPFTKTKELIETQRPFT